MEERKVLIKNIRLLKHENNKSLFYIKCGTGTVECHNCDGEGQNPCYDCNY